MGKMTVEIPCKIGDTCWAIRRTPGGKKIFQTVVSEMYFVSDMKLVVVGRNISRGEVGKDIFLSADDAIKYINELNREGK